MRPLHLPNFALCFALTILAPGWVSAEERPAMAVSAEQIEEWITSLDSNQYDVRQRAQEQLEIAELPAVEAVAVVAQSGSLESATRAINVLLFWAESKEQVLRLAALEKLAKLHHRPQESAMARRLLADAREKSALEMLVKLGAEIKGNYPNLRIRIGPEWKGGNEGLKHLAEVRHAYFIGLHVAPLTDPALEHLGSLRNVQKIELYSIDFSEEAVQKLRQQLPTTTIETRSGPMLGISGNANDPIKTSVSVVGVVAGGAANQAGILRGDRITEFNGEPVHLFTDLTDRIAKHQPGDTVKLTLLRKNKTQEVSVTFDAWGANDNTQMVQRRNNLGRQLQIQGPPAPIQKRR